VVRDRRRVRPTAAGATLVAHAEAIFGHVQAAESELAAVLGVRGGRVRVASFPSAGSTLMPLAVATFRARHPRGKVLVCSGFSEDEALRRRVLAGEYGFVRKPFTRADLMAEVRHLLAGALGPEVPAGAPRAAARV